MDISLEELQQPVVIKAGKKRGFAAMSPEKQQAIARKGGKTAHAKGTAHEFSREEARAAGKVGGHVVSQNRAYMAEIGRRGGRSSRKSIVQTPEPAVAA